MTQTARRLWWLAPAIPAAALVLIVALWDWNWFRPMVERRASAALGRPVTIAHLAVQPGWTTVIVADAPRIDNPAGFPAETPFATAAALRISIDIGEILHGRVVLPEIVVEKPVIDAVQLADRAANWNFPAMSSAGAGGGGSTGSPKIGALRITDGEAHVRSAPLRADMVVAVATDDNGQGGQIVAQARGTYGGQPITASARAGALLALRDAGTPYPIDLHLANGPTKVALTGTVQDPLHFAGAALKLQFSGSDMALLKPLTGIAFPRTPPFQTEGNLDYRDRRIKYDHFTGRLGSSDIAGDIDIDPSGARPVVTAVVHSKKVDLEDLAGFIGSQPGRIDTPNQTPAQRSSVAAAEASPRLLPTTKLNVPELKTADIHLKYRAGHILGRQMPLDDMVANLDIVDGHITLTPLSFGVGKGAIESTIDLEPQEGQNAAITKARVDFRNVDFGRMLAATGLVHGAGTITGRAAIDGTGDSVAAIVGGGNGAITLSMVGGNLSALLVDLSGFQFGKAVLSLLGIPDRSKLNCMVADLVLQRGVLTSRTLMADLDTALMTGTGQVNLARETMDLKLKTDAKHFSVGTLAAPIHITGTFKDPSVLPDIVALGVRGGAVAALAVVFPPAAILPTITFGVGDNDACARLFQGGRRAPG